MWRVAFVMCFVVPVITMGCRSNADPDAEGTRSRIKPPSVRFVDITSAAGITFRHVNGGFGKKLLPETMGSGCAFLDYDKDGKPDLLLINSCYWPGHEDASQPAPTMSLYRNLGGGKFEDVTRACGLDMSLYGMGVTAGDYDNDGWTDLFVTALGGYRLFHNVPDGKGGRKFVDVTAQAGDLARTSPWDVFRTGFLDRTEPVAFPSSAAFFDFDNDGLLDLFVCNYVTWSPRIDLSQGFTLPGGGPAYGPPRAFAGTQSVLYRNLGGGKFKDVSASAGIFVSGEHGEAAGKSLGLAVCDVDGDGWQDVIVANDTVRNFFFHNQRDGTFKERAREGGIAYSEGNAFGAMGIDCAEYRPGRFAVAIGNFANEPVTLYRLDNSRMLLFSDAAMAEGLQGPTRIVLKFGLFFFDFDLDGLLDLLICNGHLEPDIHTVLQDQQYEQPTQLYWNTGGQRAFEPVTEEEAGPDLFRPLVGRGCAYADIDGDGDLDVVLTGNNGPARLLRNEGGTGNHWIRFILEGDPAKGTNTDAIGAVVTLHAGGKIYRRHVTSARGYLSQSEMALTFGLGKLADVDRVEIRWPNRAGSVQVLEKLDVDRVHRVKQK